LDIHSLAVLPELQKASHQKLVPQKSATRERRAIELNDAIIRLLTANERSNSATATAFVAVTEERQKTSKCALWLRTLHKQFLVGS